MSKPNLLEIIEDIKILINNKLLSIDEIDKIDIIRNFSISDDENSNKLISIPPDIVITIAIIIGTGLFRKIGADLWDRVKEKIIKLIKNEKSKTKIIFKIKKNEIEIEGIIETNDPLLITLAFNKLNKLHKLIEKKNKLLNNNSMKYYFKKNKWLIKK